MPSLSSVDDNGGGGGGRGEHLSLENLQRSEVFPKQILRKISTKGEIIETTSSDVDGSLKNEPFKLLPGESVGYFSRLTNGTLVILTNFRFFVNFDEKQGFYNIPVHCIDTLECRELFSLNIFCKDGRFAKITFETNECCLGWFRLLSGASAAPTKLDCLFSFAFHAWCSDDEKTTLAELGFKTNDVYYATSSVATASSSAMDIKKLTVNGGDDATSSTSCCDSFSTPKPSSSYDFDTKLRCENEFNRLDFDRTHWRITGLNEQYKFCSTYPKFWIVPSTCADQEIETAGRYRSLRRVPAVVWRHRGNGAVLVRCSQPESGIFGWRSLPDEKLLHAILVSSDKQTTTVRAGNIPDGEICDASINACSKSMLILDARSYTAAWANRAKGGGFESTENYQKCEIQFLGLANIHAIRYSFQKLRSLCWEALETNWFQNLDACQWICHVYALLTSALRVVEALHVEGRTVLVHCSDGWDRTTQIVSLAKLLLDSHYRTMKGFKELIEREWLAFGHKFGERSGLLPGDVNQRAPVFLQWLDCVHYLLRENPCAFEFNETYLIKLAQHTYSGLFGTFLCNSVNDYLANNVGARTYSIWEYLHPSNCQFRNLLYVSNQQRGVLMPRLQLKDLAEIWRPLYCPAHDPSNLRQRSFSTTSLDADKLERCLTSTTTTLASSTSTVTILTRAHSCDNLAPAVADSNNAVNAANQNDAPFSSLGNPAVLSSPSSTIHRSGSESALTSITKLNSTENLRTFFTPLSKPVMAENEIVQDTLNSLLISVTASLNDESSLTQTSTINLTPLKLFTPTETSTPAVCSPLIKMNGDADKYEDNDDDRLYSLLAVPSGRSSLPQTSSLSPSNNDISTSTSDLSEWCVSPGGQRHAKLVTPSSSCSRCFRYKTTNGISSSIDVNANQRFGILTNGRILPSSPMVDFFDASATTPIRPYTSCCAELTKASAKKTPRLTSAFDLIDADGLTKVPDEAQHRIREMVLDYEKRLELMQNEITSLKTCVSNRQTSHAPLFNGGTFDCSHRSRNCSNNDMNGGSDFSEPRSYDSKGNVSDTSWEAVEERDAQSTLWVPDHVISRCMNCNVEFWAVKRKHHCRNCGKIFCNACTNYECPVPEEQFYEPVRVCHTCYSNLCSQQKISV